MDYFSILQDAAERADNSRFVIRLEITKLGIRVSGSRLAEDRFGKPVNALRCDRYVNWTETALSVRGNPVIRAIEYVERALNDGNSVPEQAK